MRSSNLDRLQMLDQSICEGCLECPPVHILALASNFLKKRERKRINLTTLGNKNTICWTWMNPFAGPFIMFRLVVQFASTQKLDTSLVFPVIIW
jgi:hypothetical protein